MIYLDEIKFKQVLYEDRIKKTYGIEWRNSSTSPRSKESEDFTIKDSF